MSPLAVVGTVSTHGKHIWVRVGTYEGVNCLFFRLSLLSSRPVGANLRDATVESALSLAWPLLSHRAHSRVCQYEGWIIFFLLLSPSFPSPRARASVRVFRESVSPLFVRARGAVQALALLLFAHL